MLNSVLAALEEGRLIELPDNQKKDALEVLASLLEAVPSIPSGTDIVGTVFSHESRSNTSLGFGWACPHARFGFEGELLCAIGWSPVGINYEKPADPPVRLVVMFLIPDNQRNGYLKEISSLVKVIQGRPEYRQLETFADLNTVRLRLLDMVHLATENSGSDARARMIQLKTRTAAAPSAELALENMLVEPLTIITGPSMNAIVLTQNRELAELTKNYPANIGAEMAAKGWLELKGWRIVRRGSTNYQGDHVVSECLAIRMTRPEQ